MIKRFISFVHFIYCLQEPEETVAKDWEEAMAADEVILLVIMRSAYRSSYPTISSFCSLAYQIRRLPPVVGT